MVKNNKKEIKSSQSGIKPDSDKENLLYSLIVIAVMLALIAYSSVIFAAKHKTDDIVKGLGVTDMGRLSDYFSDLKNTPGDTDVYYMEGKEPGGTLLLLGGIHPNEPAGMLASVLFIENVSVEKGRVIVIPQVNASAFSHQDPGQGAPNYFSINTEWGERTFRYGSRVTNPIHQYPDPDAYTHYPSGQLVSGSEVRNLNRVFPGKPDGMLTEKVAYSVTSLVKQEDVKIVIDCHEARPMNPIVNCIIAANEGMPVAATASMTMSIDEDILIRLEPSPAGLRGLTHRELTDHTDTMAFIMETPNPAMDNLRGPTNEELIVEGRDIFYQRAEEHGGLIYVPYPEGLGLPIDRRVGRHTSGISHLISAYSEIYPENIIEINNLPKLADIIDNGLGYYLLKP